MKNRIKGLVSIITLNMDQTDVTVEFLKSLSVSSYKNFEIIIVDQNSKEDPTDKLTKAYPDIILIKSKKNLGFTGGNNLGISHSKGEFIFCVNNDTIITETLIEELVEPLMHNNVNIGVTSPKIKYYENPEIIQYAGTSKMNPYTGRTAGNMKGVLDSKHPECSDSYQTYYAHGCAMMINYKVIEDIGFLDDDYFIYYEELDFSERVHKAGYKIWYVGSTYILHKESITVGKNSLFKEYYHTRNRILFMRKHKKNNFNLFIYYLFFIFVITPKKLILFLINKEFKHINTFFNAIKWNLKYKIK